MAKAKTTAPSNKTQAKKPRKPGKNKEVKEKRPRGRPSDYQKEIGDKICLMISTNVMSIKRILKSDESFPSPPALFRWINSNEDFRNQYARAKEAQAEMMAEEMLEIADDGSNDLMTIVKGDQVYQKENKEVTNRSRLRVDTRKWLMSKMFPKKYGEKIQQDVNVKTEPDLENMSSEDLIQIASLLDKAGTKK